jgi:hypothetical protein
MRRGGLALLAVGGGAEALLLYGQLPPLRSVAPLTFLFLGGALCARPTDAADHLVPVWALAAIGALCLGVGAAYVDQFLVPPVPERTQPVGVLVTHGVTVGIVATPAVGAVVAGISFLRYRRNEPAVGPAVAALLAALSLLPFTWLASAGDGLVLFPLVFGLVVAGAAAFVPTVLSAVLTEYALSSREDRG